MRLSFTRLVSASVAATVLAGCASAYRWGATDDPEFTARVGSVSFAQVVQELGQPVEKMPLPSGDMKVRWYARPMTMSMSQGTMVDQSVQQTEERAYWRDMRFDRNGRLTRAWMSDQRSLTDSEAP